MRKLKLLLLLLLPILIAKAAEYKVLKLNNPKILINGKAAKVGDVFNEGAVIKWTQDFQAIKVVDKKTKVRYLLVSKPTAPREETIGEILTRIGNLSTHGDGTELTSIFDKLVNDIKDSYDLMDSIEISTDLVVTDKSYFLGSYQYGDTYLSKPLKYEGRNLIIDLSLFNVDGKELEPRDIELNIDYVNGTTGQTIFIKKDIEITIIPEDLE